MAWVMLIKFGHEALSFTANPASKACRPRAVLVLGQRPRRWPNTKTALGQCSMLDWMCLQSN